MEQSASAHHLGTLSTSLQSMSEDLSLLTVLPMIVVMIRRRCR